MRDISDKLIFIYVISASYITTKIVLCLALHHILRYHSQKFVGLGRALPSSTIGILVPCQDFYQCIAF